MVVVAAPAHRAVQAEVRQAGRVGPVPLLGGHGAACRVRAWAVIWPGGWEQPGDGRRASRITKPNPFLPCRGRLPNPKQPSSAHRLRLSGSAAARGAPSCCTVSAWHRMCRRHRTASCRGTLALRGEAAAVAVAAPTAAAGRRAVTLALQLRADTHAALVSMTGRRAARPAEARPNTAVRRAAIELAAAPRLSSRLCNK